jgi:hypothetical protein
VNDDEDEDDGDDDSGDEPTTPFTRVRPWACSVGAHISFARALNVVMSLRMSFAYGSSFTRTL